MSSCGTILESPVPGDYTDDTVFEVGSVIHHRLDKTHLPVTIRKALLSAFTDSVPNDHPPEVLLAAALPWMVSPSQHFYHSLVEFSRHLGSAVASF